MHPVAHKHVSLNRVCNAMLYVPITHHAFTCANAQRGVWRRGNELNPYTGAPELTWYDDTHIQLYVAEGSHGLYRQAGACYAPALRSFVFGVVLSASLVLAASSTPRDVQSRCFLWVSTEWSTEWLGTITFFCIVGAHEWLRSCGASSQLELTQDTRSIAFGKHVRPSLSAQSSRSSQGSEAAIVAHARAYEFLNIKCMMFGICVLVRTGAYQYTESYFPPSQQYAIDTADGQGIVLDTSVNIQVGARPQSEWLQLNLC
jgi:hypothetical protein